MVICLVAGLLIGQWAAPEPVVGVVRFEGAIDFAAADQMVDLLERARQNPSVGAVVLELYSPSYLCSR